MIGLSGAHRTGKTTLAREFAKATGTFFLETKAAGTMRALGKNPQEDHPLCVRLEIQRAMLTDLKEQYESAPSLFVTDRTPVDVIGYLMAAVTPFNVSPILNREINELVQDCRKVTVKYFKMVCIIQPGIPLVEDPLKAHASESYMDLLNRHMTAELLDDSWHGKGMLRCSMPVEKISMEARLQQLVESVSRATPLLFTYAHDYEAINREMLN